jgi:hypothetical protein
MVEQWPFKPEVLGSSPRRPTTFPHHPQILTDNTFLQSYRLPYYEGGDMMTVHVKLLQEWGA